MYYQECRKRRPDDYFSLKKIRTWQIAFETQQSMTAETTSRTKQPELMHWKNKCLVPAEYLEREREGNTDLELPSL